MYYVRVYVMLYMNVCVYVSRSTKCLVSTLHTRSYPSASCWNSSLAATCEVGTTQECQPSRSVSDNIHAMPCIVLYMIGWSITVLCCTVCIVLLWGDDEIRDEIDALLSCVVLYCIALYCIVLYFIASLSQLSHGLVLWCAALLSSLYFSIKLCCLGPLLCVISSFFHSTKPNRYFFFFFSSSSFILLFILFVLLLLLLGAAQTRIHASSAECILQGHRRHSKCQHSAIWETGCSVSCDYIDLNWWQQRIFLMLWWRIYTLFGVYCFSRYLLLLLTVLGYLRMLCIVCFVLWCFGLDYRARANLHLSSPRVSVTQ